MFAAILGLSAARLAACLFSPVLVAALCALSGFRLAAFLIFQIFIEGFVVWQLAIGVALHGTERRRFFLFLGLMVFGILYRLATTIHQLFGYLASGTFGFMHAPAWVIPFHLFATFGVIYAFRLNAAWIVDAEKGAGRPAGGLPDPNRQDGEARSGRGEAAPDR